MKISCSQCGNPVWVDLVDLGGPGGSTCEECKEAALRWQNRANDPDWLKIKIAKLETQNKMFVIFIWLLLLVLFVIWLKASYPY